MSISNYAELKILEHVVGKTAWTMPTTVYIKLHTGDPGEDGTSSAAAETSRKSLAWGTASAGSIAATGSPVAEWTSLTNAETFSHFSLWDTVGPAGGNCLWKGSLSSPATVASGDTFQITALTLSLD